MTGVSSSSKLMVGVLLHYWIIQRDKERGLGASKGKFLFSFEQGSIMKFKHFNHVSPVLRIHLPVSGHLLTKWCARTQTVSVIISAWWNVYVSGEFSRRKRCTVCEVQTLRHVVVCVSVTLVRLSLAIRWQLYQVTAVAQAQQNKSPSNCLAFEKATPCFKNKASH